MRGRGPQRRRKPPVPRAESERGSGWLTRCTPRMGSPTPPTGREVQIIVAKSNESRAASRAQRRPPEGIHGAAFRRAKSRRREYCRSGAGIGQARRWGRGKVDAQQRPRPRRRIVIPGPGTPGQRFGKSRPQVQPNTGRQPSPETSQRLRGEGHTGVSMIADCNERHRPPSNDTGAGIGTGRAAAVAAVWGGPSNIELLTQNRMYLWPAFVTQSIITHTGRSGIWNTARRD